MNKWFLMMTVIVISACTEKTKELSAQEIVDKSIAVSGGDNYITNDISFRFRKMEYTAKGPKNERTLTRSFEQDSTRIKDVRTQNDFKRYVNDSLVVLSDSLANVYANAVNSVNYFAYLPYGLNDDAVNKRYLGTVTLNGTEYHKVEVTFNQEGGGDDFDDIYVYWFNIKTYKPEFLAYEFQVNGGGQRFRKAINERAVGGIRFVDYENYKSPYLEQSVHDIDQLYESGKLELLSEILLEEIMVNPGNYN